MIGGMRFVVALCAAGLLAVSAAAAEDLIRPDPFLTPGDTLPVTAADVCHPGCAKSIRHVDGRTKAKVYREYGIDRESGYYEIDHLISLSLGGSNDIRNLWPQSYSATSWGADAKDKLEERLHALVCSGAVTLREGAGRSRGGLGRGLREVYRAAIEERGDEVEGRNRRRACELASVERVSRS